MAPPAGALSRTAGGAAQAAWPPGGIRAPLPETHSSGLGTHPVTSVRSEEEEGEGEKVPAQRDCAEEEPEGLAGLLPQQQRSLDRASSFPARSAPCVTVSERSHFSAHTEDVNLRRDGRSPAQIWL